MIGALVKMALGRFSVPLAAAAGFAVALAGAAAWDRFVDDPVVAAAARRGYVLEAENTATTAELAEVKRQLRVIAEARDRYARGLAQAEAASAARAEQLESEISAYERKLAADGRRRLLDRTDIDWLRQP